MLVYQEFLTANRSIDRDARRELAHELTRAHQP
jgi:hypothetical protein